MDDIRTNAPQGVDIVLIANKSDLAHKAEVDTARGQELAEEYGILFFEASAKVGANVYEAFFALAHQVHTRLLAEQKDKHKKGPIGGATPVSLRASEKNRRPCCGGSTPQVR